MAEKLTDGVFMDEELDGNPYLEKFYEYMAKKIPGVNPYALPL